MNLINFTNKIGIYALFILIILVPLHFLASKVPGLTYYREIFAFLFLTFFIFNLYHKRFVSFHVDKEIFFLLLFPFLLCISALYDPMIDLYGFGENLDYISKGSSVDPRIYILRNAILYVPLVLYLSERGISKKELRDISLICILIAPFSILSYLYDAYEKGEVSIFLLADMAELGGANIEYNSYVPYLTFPFISALYLVFIRSSVLVKILSFGSMAIMAIFIFLSSSRQSLLLLVFAAFLFLYFDSSTKSKKFLIYSLSSAIGLLTFFYITFDVVVNEDLLDKYNDGGTSRFEILSEGIQLLRFHEFFTGAGLSSIVNSGPHNDYIRWTQRVGVFFMFISFVPFFIGAFKAYSSILRKNLNTQYIYLFLILFFTIYHSMFGYPREDAYQAIFAFLGLALWLGYTKHQSNLLRIQR